MQAEERGSPVTDKEINGTKQALTSLNTKALDQVHVPILRELCAQNRIDLGVKKKLKKKESCTDTKVGHSLVAFMRPMGSYKVFTLPHLFWRDSSGNSRLQLEFPESG